MALSKLSGDEQCVIFSQLCNPLDTRIAVAFGSTSSELRAVTQAPRQQLRADHEVAAALCLKMGEGSCKSLRKAIRDRVRKATVTDTSGGTDRHRIRTRASKSPAAISP